jgi:hypothetical protein
VEKPTFEEHNDLYSSTNIVWVIKSRKMKWAGYVAHMGGRRGVYWVLVGKPDGKRPLKRPIHRKWIILRSIFRKLDGGHGVD